MSCLFHDKSEKILECDAEALNGLVQRIAEMIQANQDSETSLLQKTAPEACIVDYNLNSDYMMETTEMMEIPDASVIYL